MEYKQTLNLKTSRRPSNRHSELSQHIPSLAGFSAFKRSDRLIEMQKYEQRRDSINEIQFQGNVMTKSGREKLKRISLMDPEIHQKLKRISLISEKFTKTIQTPNLVDLRPLPRKMTFKSKFEKLKESKTSILQTLRQSNLNLNTNVRSLLKPKKANTDTKAFSKIKRFRVHKINKTQGFDYDENTEGAEKYPIFQKIDPFARRIVNPGDSKYSYGIEKQNVHKFINFIVGGYQDDVNSISPYLKLSQIEDIKQNFETFDTTYKNIKCNGQFINQSQNKHITECNLLNLVYYMQNRYRMQELQKLEMQKQLNIFH